MSYIRLYSLIANHIHEIRFLDIPSSCEAYEAYEVYEACEAYEVSRWLNN